MDISDIYFELEPNQDGKIFLHFSVSRTYQSYGLNIKVQSYKETYNIDLDYKFKAFHFSENDLKKAVGIKHSDD